MWCSLCSLFSLTNRSICGAGGVSTLSRMETATFLRLSQSVWGFKQRILHSQIYFSQFCVEQSCRKALFEQCADFRECKCFGGECMCVLGAQSEVSYEQPVPKGGVRALSCRRKVMHCAQLHTNWLSLNVSLTLFLTWSSGISSLPVLLCFSLTHFVSESMISEGD